MFLAFLPVDALLGLVRVSPAPRTCELPARTTPVAPPSARSYPEATWKIGRDGRLFLSWKMK